MPEHNQQGTGKHPHKSTEDPRAETKTGGSALAESTGRGATEAKTNRESNESGDLK